MGQGVKVRICKVASLSAKELTSTDRETKEEKGECVSLRRMPLGVNKGVLLRQSPTCPLGKDITVTSLADSAGHVLLALCNGYANRPERKTGDPCMGWHSQLTMASSSWQASLAILHV